MLKESNFFEGVSQHWQVVARVQDRLQAVPRRRARWIGAAAGIAVAVLGETLLARPAMRKMLPKLFLYGECTW